MERLPGWSPYVYTADNPLKFVDPDGELLITAGLIALVAALTTTQIGNTPTLVDPMSVDGVPNPVIPAQSELGAALEIAGKVTALSIIASGLQEAFAKDKTIPAGGPKEGSSGGPNAGKTFTEKHKDQAERDAGGKCVFCGKPTTRTQGPHPNRRNSDHAIPKSRGGNNDPTNIQNTCQTCNLKKGMKTTREFLDDEKE